MPADSAKPSARSAKSAAPSGREAITLTVAIATYKEPVDEVRACLEPLARGPPLPMEVVVFDQMGRPDMQAMVEEVARGAANEVRAVRIEDRSLSFARNEGLRTARGRYVAFLDPDTVPAAGWASELLRAFATESPPVVAGRILPLHERPPGLLNRSTLVREVQSTLELGQEALWTDRAVGANFAVDREAAPGQLFREDLGRQHGVLLGGEETEFCERVAPGRVLYWPGALVQHRVPRGRMRLRWLVRRFYFGGVSRGLRGGPPRPLTRKRTFADAVALAFVGVPYAVGLAKGRRLRAGPPR